MTCRVDSAESSICCSFTVGLGRREETILTAILARSIEMSFDRRERRYGQTLLASRCWSTRLHI